MAGFLSRSFDKLKSWIYGLGYTGLWLFWLFLVLTVIYFLRVPLKLSENVSYGKYLLYPITLLLTPLSVKSLSNSQSTLTNHKCQSVCDCYYSEHLTEDSAVTRHLLPDQLSLGTNPLVLPVTFRAMA